MKQHILQRYKELVQDRIDVFQDMIASMTAEAQNDAKGSAGDKHETTLAMLHLEQEKLRHKLQEYLTQRQVLDKINPELVTSAVALGSLVQVNELWLFIATALPKITHEGSTVFALSPQSPLAQKIMGHTVGYTFELQSQRYTIRKLY